MAYRAPMTAAKTTPRSWTFVGEVERGNTSCMAVSMTVVVSFFWYLRKDAMHQPLTLRHFSQELLLGSFTLVLGRHGSGKTALLRDLACGLKIDAAVAVGLDGVPTRSSLDARLLAEISEALLPHQTVLLLLDGACERKALSSDAFRSLVGDKRLTVVLALPTAAMLPAHLRPSVACVFQFAEPQLAVRKSLYTHFAGFTKTYDDFSRVLDGATHGFGCLVVWLQARSRFLDQIFFWYHVDDLGRAVSLAPLLSEDESDDENCRVVDDIAVGTTKKPLAEWLGRHFAFYDGDVLADFRFGGKFTRKKVGDWFVPFETIRSLWKAEGLQGSDSDLGRELTKGGWHEWIVNLKNKDGKRRTTRARVGLRRKLHQ